MNDTTSEQYRHQCEVRHCIRMGREWFDEYLAGVAKQRGKEAAQHLLASVKQQARLGNEGKAGDWREERDA